MSDEQLRHACEAAVATFDLLPPEEPMMCILDRLAREWLRLKPAPEVVLLSYRETTDDELAATAGFVVVPEPWSGLGDVVGKVVMG